MAWIDDRIWCHEKLVDLSDRAFRVWVNGITYSSGFHTKGHLTDGQQRIVGTTPKIRGELVTAGLWEPNGNGVAIHDWDEHNAKRDERRAKDRERKRTDRESKRQSSGASAGQSAGRSGGRSTVAAHVDGSEGSDG